jgi:hypothetical protein
MTLLKNIDEVPYGKEKYQDQKVLWKMPKMWGRRDGY